MPIIGLINPVKGSVNAIAESLTNIVWAPCRRELSQLVYPPIGCGRVIIRENDRLYEAVKACSDFAKDLGINIHRKGSLSMKQKYHEGDVLAPGTVIISSAGQCEDINKIVTPVALPDKGKLTISICLQAMCWADLL